MCGDHAKPHVGIGSTGLRKAFGFEQSPGAKQRYLGEDRLVRDVELEVSDGFAIGRPPVRGSDFELFGVDPVEFAVQQGV